MITVITGASGSGKSVFAEQYSVERWNKQKQIQTNTRLVYVATMKVFGEEGKQKVERHRRQREGKGFELIEQEVDIGTIDGIEKNDIVLVECLSNLLANEWYSDTMKEISKKDVVKKILDGLQQLHEMCTHMIVVTNEIFQEQLIWEDGKDYVESLGQLNQILCQKAENVYEVVAGIPMELTKKKEENQVEKNGRIVVLGGAYQGKRNWVRSKWNQIEETEMKRWIATERNDEQWCMIVDCNQYIKQQLKQSDLDKEESVQTIRKQIRQRWNNANNVIVIIDEIGYGLVPLEKKDRIYRELMGRVTCDLVEEATHVYRLIGGISVQLK